MSKMGLEEARDRLLEKLADYQAFSGRKVIVIFDAYRVPGLGKAFSQNKVGVYFTKEKETADECIERLVREFAHRRRRIYVATSDMVEQHVIFGQGALRVSARELLTQVEQGEKEIQNKIAERSSSIGRNTIDAKLSPEMRKLFEQWRRE
ncbi:YacP-like NYN domain protein [compost metagenome]